MAKRGSNNNKLSGGNKTTRGREESKFTKKRKGKAASFSKGASNKKRVKSTGDKKGKFQKNKGKSPKKDGVVEKAKGGVKRQKSSEDNNTDTPRAKKIKVEDGKKIVAKKTMRRERDTSDKMKETIKKAKGIWEKLRRHDMKKDARVLALTELMELIKDNVFELVKKHDTARIIQCMLRFGAQDTRIAVYETLKEHTVELSKLKYAKFVVKSLFKYCTPEQRGNLITMLYNNVLRLVKHTEASEIVELAYNDYANATQRSLMLQEFYGPQYALFKDKGGRSLGQILADDPEQSSKLIGHMKRVLLSLTSKSVVKHSIIHKVLLDFLLNADEQSRSEVIEGMREVVVEMLHTREGAKVVLNCLWHGNAKDRKVLIKSFKGFVTKICKEEHGHIVLMGMFDCVDDTVLVTKTILSEMISSLSELCNDRYARRVFLYLLNPRSPQHFSNQFVQLLKPGDDNPHSKKPQGVRWAELCNGISPSLIKLTSDKAIEWACDKPMAPLLIQVALYAKGDVVSVYQGLVGGLKGSEDINIVQDPCGHWVLKRLIANEREDQSLCFTSVLMEAVGDKDIYSWTECNRGCFVLASLLQNSVSKPRVSKIVRPFVKGCEKGGKVENGAEVLVKTFNENSR